MKNSIPQSHWSGTQQSHVASGCRGGAQGYRTVHPHGKFHWTCCLTPSLAQQPGFPAKSPCHHLVDGFHYQCFLRSPLTTTTARKGLCTETVLYPVFSSTFGTTGPYKNLALFYPKAQIIGESVFQNDGL